MRHRMREPRGLKAMFYDSFVIDINEYFAVFHKAKVSDKICEMELNEKLLNSMPNIWIRQAYVQGFVCESIIF